MQTVIKLIREKEWKKLLEWATALSEEERIKYLQKVYDIHVADDIMTIPRPEKYDRNYYDLYGLYSELLSYTQLVITQNKKELVNYSKDNRNGYSALQTLLYPEYLTGEALIAFYSLYPADYLTKEISGRTISFYCLWGFYEKGWIPFNEEQFVMALFSLPWGKKRSLQKDLDFLSAYPETIENVLLQFYKYQPSVLDIASWDDFSGHGYGKGTNYWEIVFKELLNRNMISGREIILHLINGLSNDWKKVHIDWFIRLIRLFEPTTEELLAYQRNLLAAVYSKNSSVTNFVVECVQKIFGEKAFNTELFLQSVPVILSKEKCDKSILITLKLIDKLLSVNSVYNTYAADIATAFIQPNEKIQQTAAQLLLKYIAPEQLPGLIAPFISQLRKEALDILKVESNIEEDFRAVSEIIYDKLDVPGSWEDLLFHLGKTVKLQQAADIDLFFDSLVLLQDQLPDGYPKQIKPLIKSLFKKWSDKILDVYLGEFFDNWLDPESEYKKSPRDHDHTITYHLYPFIRHRNVWVLDRLKRKVKLSFLSTPVYAPCYVDAFTLVNRLLQHEQTGEKVEPEDLLIACSRILPGEIPDEVKKAAQQLKGDYKEAIHYLLGITDKITLTDSTLLSWAQVTRTRNPEGIFPEFEKTEISAYPTVIRPFDITYELIKHTSDSSNFTWYSLKWDTQHTNKWKKENNLSQKPYPLYGRGFFSEYLDLQAALYHLSLVPRYPDAYLTSLLSSFDEMLGVDKLTWMIESHIRVYHGGWLFVAACLVSKDKPTRQAATSYISMAIMEGFIKPEYLSGYITTLVTERYAPVNRLLEYLNTPSGKQTKELQLCIVEKCIRKAEKGNLPIGFKKLFIWYTDLAATLNIKPNQEIENKIKSLKTK